MPNPLSAICTIPVPISIAADSVGQYEFPANTLTVDFFASGDLYWRLVDPPPNPLAIHEFFVPGRMLRRWRDRNLTSRVLYFANKSLLVPVTMWVIVEKGIDA